MSTAGKAIEISDDHGVVRIRIGIGCDGTPYLSLNDADGLERIVLSVDAEGDGGIAFRAASGQPVASFGVSRESGVGMEVMDVETGVWLTVGLSEGVGGVALQTPDGTQVWPKASASVDQ